MMRRMLTMLGVVTLVVSTMAGCSWTQKGAAIGGGAGALTGGIWAGNAGNLSIAEGALVGLAAGGLAGALVGDLIDQRDFARELQEREKELAARKALTDKQAQQLEDLEAKLRECEKKRRELEKEIADLRKQLGDLGDKIKIGVEGDKIVLTILTETLYASGKAQLTAEGKQVLDRAMRIIRKRFPGRDLLVRGHTDSEPIKHSGWKSNWELGAARALGVLHYFMKKHGVKGETISAATYAFYQPVAGNISADGRRKNRRAEIVILPKREVVLKRAE